MRSSASCERFSMRWRRAGRGGAVGVAGIGKTILWKAGVGEARARIGQVLTAAAWRRRRPCRSRGCRSCSVRCWVRRRLRWRRRGAGRLRLRAVAEPGDGPLDPCGWAGCTRRAEGLSQTVRCSSRSMMCNGSIRPRPVCFRLRSGVSAETGSGCSQAFGVPRVARSRLDSDSLLRGAQSFGRPAEPGSVSSSPRRAPRFRVDPVGARARAAGSGGNPYFALELGRELVRLQTRPGAGQRLGFRKASVSR